MQSFGPSKPYESAPLSPVPLILDTTVLSNFALVGKLVLLRQILEGLSPLITSQVQAEFRQGEKKGLFRDTDIGWIEVVRPSRKESQLALAFRSFLGKGEASCMSIALERGFHLATDDMKAREVARRLGIPVTGTLGILGDAVREGLLSFKEGDSILEAMREQGYFSPVASLKELLELGGEGQDQ